MGINYEVGCSICAYNFHLKEGTASDFTSFENILKKYNVEQKREIKKILKKYDLKSKNRIKNPRYEKNPFSEERIYKCRKCGNLESQLYIRISVPEKWMFDTGKNIYFTEKNILFRIINNCSKCGTRLRHYKESITKCKCPECKMGELKVLNKKVWN
ncbi:MAG: hypothetical protein KAS21_06035 [Candidatus Aminicenantes bacterium]|nr:hypothetical protein [Candidatus Aminicenantes bacterium]